MERGLERGDPRDALVGYRFGTLALVKIKLGREPNNLLTL